MHRQATIATAIVAICLALAVAPHSHAQPVPKPSELAAKIGELTRRNKFDEAIALLRAKAAEPEPDPEVPMLMFVVGSWHASLRNSKAALPILQTITTQFPNSEAAMLAWCGIGEIHSERGERDRMLAALERGVSDRRFLAQAAVDHGSTRALDFACRAMGDHYMELAQWNKALPFWLAWRPNTGCGTCQIGAETVRLNNILLCQVRSERFREAIDTGWRELVAGSWATDELTLFVLVRLYAEAGQLDDLRSQYDQVCAALNETVGKPLAARMTSAIALAESKRFSDHISVFEQASNDGRLMVTPSTDQHVAAWVLIREHKRTIQTVLKAARQYSAAGERLTAVLAATNSPAAKSALGLLSRNATPARRALVNEPYPLPVRFHEPWPAIARGSLPTALPADLIAEKKR